MRVLVYGWYYKGNLGDDLFIDAFKHIFPNFEFTFTDYIKFSHLENIDAVFIGGGSFLGEACKISPDAIELLKSKTIFYLGVGSETNIHETHQQLISLSKLVAIRSSAHIEHISKLNSNIMVIPDLVYALPTQPATEKNTNSILFIPNMSVVPRWNDPHWKHAAWNSFKIELVQALDVLSKEKYQIKFLPFCTNNKMHDSYVAGEIINCMNESKINMILDQPKSLSEAIDIISKNTLTVTQRFHGSVLSEMANTTSLTIHHHDKLKNYNGFKIDYYACNKNLLLDKIKSLLEMKNDCILPIDRNIFISLKERVENALCRNQKQ